MLFVPRHLGSASYVSMAFDPRVVCGVYYTSGLCEKTRTVTQCTPRLVRKPPWLCRAKERSSSIALESKYTVYMS
ncbi:hypothetical protein AHAS_Ahas11G0087200 [Arachis hypogaea]